jgi:hypothetical protein
MRFTRLAKYLGLAIAWSSLVSVTARGQTEQLPTFGEVQHVVASHFQTANHRPGDIISKSQVEQVLKELKNFGWEVGDKQEILGVTLDDSHVLVSTLRTPAGRRFMGKISARDLMYDRLDRISQVSGGSQLIRDLVKLPDGEKYAKPRSGGGVPDLLDLLPKGSSGKTRRISDYHKPTGHLYTVDNLVARLAESYSKDAEQVSPLPAGEVESDRAGKGNAAK